MQHCKAVLYHWESLAAGLVAVIAATAVVFAEVSTRTRLKGVTRAEKSWNYFYIMLGFAPLNLGHGHPDGGCPSISP